jgi:hypothetical protein
MRESQLGFEYSWADLKPIRVLAVTVIALQLVGAAVGLALPRFPGWFESLWFGAAITTFPAFLLGAFLQSRLTPGRISQHKVMVWRCGLIAAVLSAAALAMSILGFGNAA